MNAFVPTLLLKAKGKPFSPANIAGLRLWLKADADVYSDAAGTIPAVYDGDVVGCWKDQSGNGYDVSQATTSKKPLLRIGADGINGRPTVSFDSSDDLLVRNVADFLSTDQSGSIFFAINSMTIKAYRAVFASNDEATATYTFNLDPYFDSGHARFDFNYNATHLIQGTTVWSNNTVYIFSIQSDSTEFFLRLNGADEAISAGTNNGNWFGDLANRDNFTVGGYKHTSELGIMAKISELLIYNSCLTDIDLTNVENYLNHRYAAY